ncbi:MAG: DNA recombination protein RmuC [Bacteroidota bacterium]|nr:DNA recombination protein RmuC [Bacteroidota bacterium]MEC8367554.1 DNA recombination protein RmuC [Bacteroidota bacterium]MEC8601940.1 DNA recombination protein RmuC [Bacteroidota bacterium]
MDSIILILLVLSNIGLLLYFFSKRNNNQSDLILKISNNLTNQVQDIRKEISENSEKSRAEIESKLQNINKEISEFQMSSKTQMQKQFSDSNKIIKEVTVELEKIKGTNEQVLSFANQMKTLEKILGNQKQRGIFGEIQLENLLSNVLPPEIFQMQYSFKDGGIVDAIVKVNDNIIPIDAKFSLDNYNKMIESSDENEINLLEKKFKEDIKSRIDETAKYIRPQEKTLDYAFMFIPADGLYQDLLNSRVGSLKIRSKELVSYAYQKKVMIVSPMSLFPMLQITMKALNNLKFEKSIELVIKNVQNLSDHLITYQTYHNKLGNTLNTVVNHYNRTSDEFKKIDKDVMKISEGKFNIDFQKQLIDKTRDND